MNFTTVIGIDRHHLTELQLSVQTWKRFRPEIFENPVIVFYDRSDFEYGEIERMVDAMFPTITHLINWPMFADPADYDLGIDDKWHIPQRNKMLSGFVHVPARYVETPYWLKLDTDTFARRESDWIDESWFEESPSIIAHPWGYTKPPNQIQLLDEWGDTVRFLKVFDRLNYRPKPGSGLVKHKRIISWCGFFRTAFTKSVAAMCKNTVGADLMPVPSQDGLMGYVAERMQHKILRVNMKKLGWDHVGRGLEKQVREVLK